jgi:hypothetical protein
MEPGRAGGFKFEAPSPPDSVGRLGADGRAKRSGTGPRAVVQVDHPGHWSIAAPTGQPAFHETVDQFKKKETNENGGIAKSPQRQRVRTVPADKTLYEIRSNLINKVCFFCVSFIL